MNSPDHRLFSAFLVVKVLLLCLACLAVLSGCSSTSSYDEAAVEEMANPLIVAPQPLPRRVAILPFTNASSAPKADEQVRRIFYNYFSSLNYLDVELSLVDATFNDLRLESLFSANAFSGRNELGGGRGSGGGVNPEFLDSPEFEQAWALLCNQLDVDGFITGTVYQYGKAYAVLYSETVVELGVQFRHCDTGRYIWRERMDSTKREGDLPLSPTALAAAIVTTYMRHQDISELEVAAKLSMELTSRIPNPQSAITSAPEITSFLHNGSGRLLVPGNQLKVVMLGRADMSAHWSIPGVVERIPMTEQEPGVYIGEYHVAAGDRALDAQLVGYLESADGVVSRWIDILEPVTLGAATPIPAVIRSDLTLTAEASPYRLSQIAVVTKNATLNLEPGTLIWSDGAGLIVNGRINAIGNAVHPIRFRSTEGRRWKGITINATSGQMELAYVAISNADIGLNVVESRLYGNNLILEHNNWGVVVQHSSVDLKDSQIRHSHRTGLSCRNSEVFLYGNYIAGNQTGGGMFQGSTVTASGNGFFNNGDWDIRNLDRNQPLLLPGNWWGTPDSGMVRTVGAVEVDPVLMSQP
ncbi:MAG: right-handed parallel beta-helix repeat-containing protein [Pseudomonadales bacterium]|nr:right-handed parallel beta-helix repeat-containing protein [Pseudomonadales bacterium]